MLRRKSQSDHDKMVTNAAIWLAAKGYSNIKADTATYNSPEKITWKKTGKGHIPDLSATNSDNKLFIFEAETKDSIGDQHTADQWKLFSAFAVENSIEFWVIVPSDSVQSANDRLKELGLTAKVWGV